MKPPSNPTSGIVLVDKPQGITSHDVVARARKSIGTRKVGHAGTLDPMATGLLVLGVNNSTRLLTWVVGLDKEYTATIRLGADSNTDDADGQVGEPVDAATLAAVTDTEIASGVLALTGPILQRPSSVSAIKVGGKRAYALAREGEEVVLAERPVTIGAFEVIATRRGEWLDLDVRVECSTGTYIRALARDLGAALGVGGHLTALRRTRIGPFTVGEASGIEADLAQTMLDPAEVASALFDRADLTAQEAIDLAHGKRISLSVDSPGPIAAVSPEGRLIGLVENIDGRAHVLVNFPPDLPPAATETASE
ncbi:tRNA pseudouridine(55) synthase TruB [Salinibacterium sp. G-O1]|uniref:tRNA pseudouridine(55) synthase TruB n=1 Tax=Salinibacterium sp. G-O1 TaxID=3046208 RepID=UPI0024B9F2A1|nr:tRNA pseudouridine(55) synthase TruB [Salinibacterium sp. G-O1]MDJ0334737.1 tRNA pseudouridine(55) synthase TruB [Salinibacterium sp. G-O1]